MFTARGYNIDSLTVADITENHAVSRITIVTHGPPAVIDQIIAQLDRLVPVHKVTDLTEVGPHVERELALVKVAGTGDTASRRCASPRSFAPRGRHDDRQLRVRGDRRAREDRQIRRADARSRPGRGRRAPASSA